MNARARATHPARVIASVLLLIIALVAFAALGLHAQDSHRTVLYLHGRIYTNDPQHPWAQALAVRDGRIFFRGDCRFRVSLAGACRQHLRNYADANILPSRTARAWAQGCCGSLV